MNGLLYILIIGSILTFCNTRGIPCRSHSQRFEDLILFKACFQNFTGAGVYLEAGALDGLTYSNTYFYESCFRWRGILIEPAPSSYAKLIVNRNSSRNLLLNVAGCKEKNRVKFFDNKEVGGRPDLMTEKYKNQYKDYHKNLVEVDCVPLTQLIKQRYSRINFFSLDVEGAELDFLESIDFDEIQFDIIIAEYSDEKTKNSMLEEYLIARGFMLYKSVVPHSYLFIHKTVDYCVARLDHTKYTSLNWR